MSEEYPYWTEVSTRWRDNDIYGHVNNVVYYSLMDTVINRWLIDRGGLDIHEGGAIGVCVRSQCDYLAPSAFPDVLRVGLRVAHLGRSSVRYQLVLCRDDGDSSDTILARGEFVHVFVSRHGRRPTPIHGRLRDALTTLSADHDGR